jgi:S1-C subfamily serine protease
VEGMGFAIPIEIVMPTVEKLEAGSSWETLSWYIYVKRRWFLATI